jgi:WXG100 family type VII secretion target
MADVLKVTPEELVSAASTFRTQQQAMQTAYLQMSDAVRTLDTTWNGDASESFKTQFEAMYRNLSQTEEKMADAVDELMAAHDLFEEYENQIKAAVESLEEGTSPFA